MVYRSFFALGVFTLFCSVFTGCGPAEPAARPPVDSKFDSSTPGHDAATKAETEPSSGAAAGGHGAKN